MSSYKFKDTVNYLKVKMLESGPSDYQVEMKNDNFG